MPVSARRGEKDSTTAWGAKLGEGIAGSLQDVAAPGRPVMTPDQPTRWHWRGRHRRHLRHWNPACDAAAPRWPPPRAMFVTGRTLMSEGGPPAPSGRPATAQRRGAERGSVGRDDHSGAGYVRACWRVGVSSRQAFCGLDGGNTRRDRRRDQARGSAHARHANCGSWQALAGDTFSRLNSGRSAAGRAAAGPV